VVDTCRLGKSQPIVDLSWFEVSQGEEVAPYLLRSRNTESRDLMRWAVATQLVSRVQRRRQVACMRRLVEST
jgi:hypothetical protein